MPVTERTKRSPALSPSTRWARRRTTTLSASASSSTKQSEAARWASVLEVTHTRKDHRDVVLVGGSDHFVVAHRAARLDDRSHPRLRRFVNAVAEGEEGVRRHYRAGQRQLSFCRAELHRINAAHLPRADAD